MKPFLSFTFLLLFFFAEAQTAIDSLYLEADSLYTESLVDDENYINVESNMYICPFAPTLPGSTDSLFNFIQSKFDSAIISDSDSGVVWISFIIDTAGYFTNTFVMNGIAPEIDSACLEIIKSLPKWLPAKDSKGNRIPLSCVMPFRFIASKED